MPQISALSLKAQIAAELISLLSPWQIQNQLLLKPFETHLLCLRVIFNPTCSSMPTFTLRKMSGENEICRITSIEITDKALDSLRILTIFQMICYLSHGKNIINVSHFFTMCSKVSHKDSEIVRWFLGNHTDTSQYYNEKNRVMGLPLWHKPCYRNSLMRHRAIYASTIHCYRP